MVNDILAHIKHCVDGHEKIRDALKKNEGLKDPAKIDKYLKHSERIMAFLELQNWILDQLQETK